MNDGDFSLAISFASVEADLGVPDACFFGPEELISISSSLFGTGVIMASLIWSVNVSCFGLIASWFLFSVIATALSGPVFFPVGTAPEDSIVDCFSEDAFTPVTASSFLETYVLCTFFCSPIAEPRLSFSMISSSFFTTDTRLVLFVATLVSTISSISPLFFTTDTFFVLMLSSVLEADTNSSLFSVWVFSDCIYGVSIMTVSSIFPIDFLWVDFFALENVSSST